jgi:hypothetical protein
MPMTTTHVVRWRWHSCASTSAVQHQIMSGPVDDKNRAEITRRSRRRLRIPAVLAVAVVGGAMSAGVAAVGCSDTGSPPELDAGDVNTQGNTRFDAGRDDGAVVADAPATPVDAPAMADAAIDARPDAPET